MSLSNGGKKMTERDLLGWRVAQLEDAHKQMAAAQERMSVSLAEVVSEFRATKRAVGIVVAIVGLLQPFVFHALAK